LLALLGDAGEIERELVSELASTLLEWTDSGERRGLVSVTVLDRLCQDLADDDPLCKRVDAYRTVMASLTPLDPGRLPVASAEVRQLIGELFSCAHTMIFDNSPFLDPEISESVVGSTEVLADAGHLYRCRHIVARLLASSAGFKSEDLRERVFRLARRAACGRDLTSEQAGLFSIAIFKMVDEGRWREGEDGEDIVGQLGFERSSQTS
jgi:hypothetical protein